MKKYTFLLLCFAVFKSFAFDCYITGMTGACWKDFNVTITVYDDILSHQLASISIPKGKVWGRTKIKCTTNQGFAYKATFSPKIWKSNPVSVYSSRRIFYTPNETEKGTTAWTIPVCFPNDFAAVPLPTTATSTCSCSEIAKTVPPVSGEIINP
jgi:hypothetical protein